MTTGPDPYAVYTDMAAEFEVAFDYDGDLTPLVLALLAAAGRMLAVQCNREATALGEADVPRTVGEEQLFQLVARLPPECDGMGQAFRHDLARCFDDLADDAEAGRAPVPRCTAERWAVDEMITQAPYLLAADDAELLRLGVDVGPDTDEHSWRLPSWEAIFEALVTNDAKCSIPQARSTAVSDDEAAAAPEPDDGWDAPRFWFAPYGIAQPRDPQRPYHSQAGEDPAAGETPWPAGLSPDRAAQLLALASRYDPWLAFADPAAARDEPALPEILTPLGARLLQIAAADLSGRGFDEVLKLRDDPFPRGEPGWNERFSFHRELPPICDRQSGAWRLAMVRAIDDLADDLRVGRAPLPRCPAEELALHFIVNLAESMADALDEDDEETGFTELDKLRPLTARHRQFSLMREHFFQDYDILDVYNLDPIAVEEDEDADPDAVIAQLHKSGALQARAWWWTFGNLTPRPASRGFDPLVIERLAERTPALRNAELVGETTAPLVSQALWLQFERFVGFACRRFFDVPTAIAMARTLPPLLDALIQDPRIDVHCAWMFGQHPIVGTETLLVDDDFTVAGRQQTWRLNADRRDGDARAWTRQMLADLASKVLAAHADPMTRSLLRRERSAEPFDRHLPALVDARLAALGYMTTLSSFLRHRTAELGLGPADLAQAAILPLEVIAEWLEGLPAAAFDLIRLAPVLQVEEHLLLQAAGGERDRGYWPPPDVPKAHLGYDVRASTSLSPSHSD